MERIVRNFFFITLLFKQLVFSLFSVPGDSYDIDFVPVEKERVSEQIFTADSSEGSLDGIQFFKLMWTLALIETKNSTAPNEVFPIN